MTDWLAGSAAAKRRRDLRVLTEVGYGPHPRHRMDIWAPAAANGKCPVIAFLHGGFWQMGSKELGGFAGPAFAEAGFVFAAIGYRLAPEAALRGIAGDVRSALVHLRKLVPELGGDPDRIIVAGHSAGAHLAAGLLAGPDAAGPCASLAGLVLISGVFDLAPIAASYVNDTVHLTQGEIAELSPALHRPHRDIPVSILVGSDETPEFRRQSTLLERAWRPHLSHLERRELPGRDHFDILSGLAEPGDEAFAAVQQIAQRSTRP